MKRAIKLICLILSVAVVSGCSALPEMPFSNLEGFVQNIVYNISGNITEVEQTEVVITEESFDISCYSRLTEDQQRIYRILLTVSEKMISGWIRLGKCGKSYSSDVSLAYRALSSDRPDIFWMPSTYLISNSGTDSAPVVLITFDYEDDDNSCSYTVTKAQRDSMRQELEDKVKKITAEASKKGSFFETELYLHDYICENTEYTADGDALIYTAYGALVSGKAVCEGYSRAMQLLCDELLLPCVLVYGKSEGTGHMWNMINPGDGWYHLDVTWDDNSELIHNYFNLTDSEISSDREIWELFDPESGKAVNSESTYNLLSFECSATDSNYFNRLGYIIDKDFSAAAKAVASAHKNGKTSLQVKVINEKILSEFEQDYNRPAAQLQLRLDIMGSGVVLESISVNKNIVTFYW